MWPPKLKAVSGRADPEREVTLTASVSKGMSITTHNAFCINDCQAVFFKRMGRGWTCVVSAGFCLSTFPLLNLSDFCFGEAQHCTTGGPNGRLVEQ